VYRRILEEPVHRPALIALVVIVAAAVPTAALAGAIDLRITYRASESAAPKVFTLHCAPARGTVPHPAAACRRLIAIGDGAFAPTPRGMRTCSQIYGGPQTATVTGVYFGRSVWAKLSRVDGCALARWNRVGFLFPSPA
jgi:Subtilisin inhibitor-like